MVLIDLLKKAALKFEVLILNSVVFLGNKCIYHHSSHCKILQLLNKDLLISEAALKLFNLNLLPFQVPTLFLQISLEVLNRKQDKKEDYFLISIWIDPLAYSKAILF